MHQQETWQVRKQTVESAGGMVASQHYEASAIGARILEQGGNAIDAAIATAFAIGVLEPWQSGIGGIGHMVITPADDRAGYAIDFAAKTPYALDPRDYPLSGAPVTNMFAWPSVQDDRNVEGPYSLAVPGQVAGMAAAHAEFGVLPWHRLLEPAVSCATVGMAVDWYATLKIASAAKGLARQPASRDIYLPDGFVPAGNWAASQLRLPQTALARTLAHLAEQGGQDFYQGALARQIAEDAERLGSSLRLHDLNDYRAVVRTVEAEHYRDAAIYTAGPATGGAQLSRALKQFDAECARRTGTTPDEYFFASIASALMHGRRGGYDGNARSEEQAPSCTTHISVIDRKGNAVSLTQTLLSLFGSRVTLPRTGILMNNAVMWCDPRPGSSNAIGPGLVPRSNMCPVVAKLANGDVLALGASGGRRIFPAVMQLLVYLIDCGMSVEQALHFPRLDVGDISHVTADLRLDETSLALLAQRTEIRRQPSTVDPNLFGCPNMVLRQAGTARSVGGAFPQSPWAAAVAEGGAR